MFTSELEKNVAAIEKLSKVLISLHEQKLNLSKKDINRDSYTLAIVDVIRSIQRLSAKIAVQTKKEEGVDDDERN